MNCINCDKLIDNDSLYCKFCGTKQVEQGAFSMDEMIEEIENILSITNNSFSDTGKLKCEKWINEFGYSIVAESAKIALSQYLAKDSEGKYTKESINKVFNLIGGISKNKYDAVHKPYISDVKKIINYVKKAFRLNYYTEKDLTADLNNLLYYFFSNNMYENKVEDILALVRGSKDIDEFLDKIEEQKAILGL